MSLLQRIRCLYPVFVPLIALTTALPARAAEEVTLYTTREPALIQPLLAAFSARSGIKVNTVFVKDGLPERIKAEGERSPADVLMAVDIGNLLDLVDGGATQPLKSAVLEKAIPTHLRATDGQWFALSLRARVLFVDKDSPITSFRYEELAYPKYRGKVCMRSGQHSYNIALIAASIAHNGEVRTEQWLRGVKANLARKPSGGDRDVARDIDGGVCELGLAHSYYAGLLKDAQPGSDARRWGDAIKVIKPTFTRGGAGGKTGGTHVNISGAALARHSPQRANAVKLLEFLVSPAAQKLYAQANYEYPVLKGVPLDPVIAASIGELKADGLPVVEIGRHRKQASALVERVGFDQ